LQGTTGLFPYGIVSVEPEGWVSGVMFQMLSTHNKTQCISPSNVQIIRLPTTDPGPIYAGDLIHIINRSTNDLQIQSSSGDILDTIRTGLIKCRALIDAPVNGSDWYVEELFEKVSLSFTVNATGSCFSTTQSITMKITRSNKKLTFVIPKTTDTANPVISSSFASSTAFIPSRLIPDGATGSGGDLTLWWNSQALNRISGGNIVYVGDTVVQISASGLLRFAASTVWETSNTNGFPTYTLDAYKE
jgi:hypothetical protein